MKYVKILSSRIVRSIIIVGEFIEEGLTVTPVGKGSVFGNTKILEH